ncbi:hypothetical protein GBA65_01075 [Rubrobacter marinus]|uniref:Response regulatory domain-containing protein n=1 Tax=Rubrobacter marinus TaxID=2653852 RepID=A0A6G8PUE1_9ACTN|nr:hypothetical protein [Rubrobacter marinus]QIN77335.1 hypothetical protein GBA65_01075 [Rubrobacter marinus]
MSRLARPPYAAEPRSPAPGDPGRRDATGRAVAPAALARRAVVAEPCPRLRAAIEQALRGEGYRVVDGGLPGGSEGTVILLAGDGDGLHVLEARDVAGALVDLCGGQGMPRGVKSPALGIHAFLPRPFGAADVLRVARAVGGFDPRRRAPEP